MGPGHWLIAFVASAVVGCGTANAGDSTADRGSSSRPVTVELVRGSTSGPGALGSINARDLLERRLRNNGDFGCSLFRTIRDVRVIARDSAVLEQARRLASKLRRGRSLELVLDPAVTPYSVVAQRVRRLGAHPPGRIVVNTEGGLLASRCPRVEIDVESKRGVTEAERHFIDKTIADLGRDQVVVVEMMAVEPA